MSKRVLIGLSGGIDSTYAAWLLKSRGHEVIGVHFRLDPFSPPESEQPDELPPNELPLCSVPRNEREQDLIEFAEAMGIEVLFVELGQRFRRLVLEPFLTEYGLGRTPNPCVVCNAKIKFVVLSNLAERLDSHFYATGHYARIVKSPESGAQVVCRSLDPLKDQSYFLCRVPTSLLGRAMMPLGDKKKRDVHAEVLKLRLCKPSLKPSQDLCFVGMRGYTEILRRSGYKPQPGPIVDVELGEVGKHNGILNFTVGQRRGLSIALGSPRYVIKIDHATNTVLIGRKKYIYGRELNVSGIVWADGLEPEGPSRLNTQIRSRHKAQPALVTPNPGGNASVNLRFDQPQRSITPGQAAAFYDGDCIVGGGWIDQDTNAMAED